MKKLVMLLTAFLLLPVLAMAELNYEVVKTHRIYFPDLHELTGYFQNADQWTFVTPDNLDEHFDMVLARGGTEEEIRQRYARESFVFEAYSPMLNDNECIRMERFYTPLTREIWHCRHMDKEIQKRFFQELELGLIMPWYDAYGSVRESEGAGDTSLRASFTSIPPASLESGTMRIRLVNGTMYVLSFCSADYLANASPEPAKKDTIKCTPMQGNTFFTYAAKLLPQQPAFALDSELPTQADVGELTVSGTIRSGGTIKVTLDGAELPVTLESKKGTFTTVLPLTEEGDHEVVFTINHPKNTERVEKYPINVSGIRTTLTFTEAPQAYVPVGTQNLTGVSDPGASIVITLDENEPVTLVADENGAFSWQFEAKGDNVHYLKVMATAPDYKDTFTAEWYFVAVYEEGMDSVYAYGAELSDTTLWQLVNDPLAHVGERVMVEGQIMRIDILPGGLGLYCQKYENYRSRTEPPSFYITTTGYLHGTLHQRMVINCYGTVEGQREVDGVLLPEISMQYGTYIVFK